jgi:pimeloyl-ACP methyl ester carboxylesterase
MAEVSSDGARIVYEVFGNGPPVVLLHAFPANHGLWLPAVQTLLSRYRVILPDLRGHGDSDLGEGPATMAKHAADLARVMDDTGVGRAALVGNSIGGYIIFEFWRQYRERVSAIALCNTKAQSDSPEAKAARLQAAADVMEKGTEQYFASQILRLMGETARVSRPDLVSGAMKMMRKMSPLDVAMVQRGMAERLDSVATLRTISVPTLVITGTEDVITGVPEAELMHQNISISNLKILPKAGHYSPWEQPEEVGKLLRQFLDSTSMA